MQKRANGFFAHETHVLPLLMHVGDCPWKRYPNSNNTGIFNMKNMKIALLAATAVMGVTGSAQAALFNNLQAGAVVWGAGATLPGPTIRQAGDCFGAPSTYLGVASALHTIATPPAEPASNIYATTLNAACTDLNSNGSRAVFSNQSYTTPAVTNGVNNTLEYLGVGSGGGIRIYAYEDRAVAGVTQPAGVVLPAGTLHYAGSETALTAADIAAINNGGAATPNLPLGVTAAQSHTGGVAAGAGTYAGTQSGPVIQVPALIAPVTIAFDPVYKKVNVGGVITEYKLNIKTSAGRAPSGGLKLSRTALCGLVNGTITNWNDAELSKFNAVTPNAGGTNGVSLVDPTDPDPFNVPLQIVGRSDSSGTTSLFTRHLQAVCGGKFTTVGGTGTIPDSTTPSADARGGTVTATNSPNGNDPVNDGTEVLGLFTVAPGSTAVAKYLDFTRVPTPGNTIVQGRVGYLGPDFTLPAVNSVGGAALAYQLVTADVQNANVPTRKFIAPTPAAVTTAFSLGAGAPPAIGAARANPINWVPTTPLFDPAGAASYPIVGTSNHLLYTCYASSDVRRTLVAFMETYYGSPTITNTSGTTKLGVLAQAGLAPLPAAWRTAIRQTFWGTPASAPSLALNLYITKGVAGANFTTINPGCTAGQGAN
jgi:phosphate transport system substrate-binding protein